MFEQGKRKVWAYLISMIVYSVLMLVVIFTKQIGTVSLESLSLQLAIGIMTISGAFYLGNYGVHKYTSNKKKDANNGQE